MRIGFANGCFDGLHPGHRHFLQEACKQCDWLIVAVNSDESVKRLKGAQRPQLSLDTRMTGVSLEAHAVIPFEGNPIPLLAAIKPQVLFRGEDQTTFHVERTLIGELVVIPRLPGISTTQILQAHAQP